MGQSADHALPRGFRLVAEPQGDWSKCYVPSGAHRLVLCPLGCSCLGALSPQVLIPWCCVPSGAHPLVLCPLGCSSPGALSPWVLSPDVCPLVPLGQNPDTTLGRGDSANPPERWAPGPEHPHVGPTCTNTPLCPPPCPTLHAWEPTLCFSG